MHASSFHRSLVANCLSVFVCLHVGRHEPRVDIKVWITNVTHTKKKNNTHCNWFALLCVSSISRTVHNGEMLTTYSTNKISFQHKPYLAHLVYGDMALFDFHSAKHSLYLAGFAAPLRPDTPNGTTTQKKPHKCSEWVFGCTALSIAIAKGCSHSWPSSHSFYSYPTMAIVLLIKLRIVCYSAGHLIIYNSFIFARCPLPILRLCSLFNSIASITAPTADETMEKKFKNNNRNRKISKSFVHKIDSRHPLI